MENEIEVVVFNSTCGPEFQQAKRKMLEQIKVKVYAMLKAGVANEFQAAVVDVIEDPVVIEDLPDEMIRDIAHLAMLGWTVAMEDLHRHRSTQTN